MLKRIKNKKGETLIEVLVSLVIIVLIMVMLPAAVVVAADLNSKAEKENLSSTMQRDNLKTATVKIKYDETEKDLTGKVNVYESEGYYFYDYK